MAKGMEQLGTADTFLKLWPLKLDVFRPHIATAHSQLNTQTCLDH